MRKPRKDRDRVLNAVGSAPGRVDEGAAPSADDVLRAGGLIEKLTALGVHVPCDWEVREQAVRNADLIDPIVELARSAKASFPGSAELSLEVSRDPETAERELVLYVREPSYSDDILDRIESAWAPHRAAFDRARAWFVFTTDFKPPRGGNGV